VGLVRNDSHSHAQQLRLSCWIFLFVTSMGSLVFFIAECTFCVVRQTINSSFHKSLAPTTYLRGKEEKVSCCSLKTGRTTRLQVSFSTLYRFQNICSLGVLQLNLIGSDTLCILGCARGLLNTVHSPTSQIRLWLAT